MTERMQTRIWYRRGILHRFRSFWRMMMVCAVTTDATKMMKPRMPNTNALFIKYTKDSDSADPFCKSDQRMKKLLEGWDEYSELDINDCDLSNYP
mmetsp:Transcript_12277/g.33751  ORF Transcript_12277/g.33751 Transcript_12277/m.33751 type:complete len:95 (-) Transcript_12277:237-521(-)